MKEIKLLIALVIITVIFAGCSEKMFRTKPTTFINVGYKISNDSRLNYYCIDTDEKFAKDSNTSKPYKCDDYLILDIENLYSSKFKDFNKSLLATKLFYIADRNCKKFTDRFQSNYFGENISNKIFNLSILGVGVNIGALSNISNEQFSFMKDNLSENLTTRKTIKEKIMKRINDNNYSNEDMLVDFINYDNSCSLFKDLSNQQ